MTDALPAAPPLARVTPRVLAITAAVWSRRSSCWPRLW